MLIVPVVFESPSAIERMLLDASVPRVAMSPAESRVMFPEVLLKVALAIKRPAPEASVVSPETLIPAIAPVVCKVIGDWLPNIIA